MGLNLTRAVRLGILKHTSLKYREPEETCSCDMGSEIEKEFDPLSYKKDVSDPNDIFEVQLVSLADEFAQVVHDFEDSILSDSLPFSDCIKDTTYFPLVCECYDKMLKKTPPKYIEKLDPKRRDKQPFILSRLRSELIYQLTLDLIKNAAPSLNDWEEKNLNSPDKDEKIQKFDIFVKDRKDFAHLMKLKQRESAFYSLKEQLNSLVVHSERVSRMDGKADYIIRNILDVYTNDPRQAHQQVLDEFKLMMDLKKEDIRKWEDYKLDRLKSDKAFLRACVDYVAGMTDRFARKEYDQLYSAYPRVEL
jgi:dGTPase